MNRDSLIFRYLLATVGMFFVAAGIALSIISNLGTAPLSCPAYVASLKWDRISVGTFTWIVNCIYMLVQIAVLRKRFKPKYFLQFAASVLLGYMIDASLLLFRWLTPATMVQRLLVTVLGCAVTALGTSVEVHAKAWMLSAEMTVNVLSKEYGWRFSTVKIVMDSSLVVISSLFCLVFWGNPFGPGSIFVIGWGTLITAFLIGWMMNYTDPVVEYFSKLNDKWQV